MGSGYADYSSLDLSLYQEIYVTEFTDLGPEWGLRAISLDGDARDLAKQFCQTIQAPYHGIDDGTGYPPVAVGTFVIYTASLSLDGRKVQMSKNNGVHTPVQTTGVYSHSDLLLTTEINYHPDGDQTFIPHDPEQTYYMLLGLRNESQGYHGQEPVMCVLKLKGFGISIPTGTWHQPPLLPVDQSGIFSTAQAATHACVTHRPSIPYAVRFSDE